MRLGILFDIDALDGGFYGFKAYKLLFRVVDLPALAGCTLLDGDTSATLRGERRDYCIAVDAPAAEQLEKVRLALLRSGAAGLRPAGSRFVDDAAVGREPLVLAARVTYTGDLMQYTGWVREAWKTAGEERRAAVLHSEAIISNSGGPTMTVTTDEPSGSQLAGARASEAGSVGPDRPVGNLPSAARASEFMPCPQCGAAGVGDISPVRYTWWGGVVGPRLLHHVKCVRCGTTYNGATGRSNGGAIAGYLAVIFIVCTVLYAWASSAQF